jgi:hypothetical protein
MGEEGILAVLRRRLEIPIIRRATSFFLVNCSPVELANVGPRLILARSQEVLKVSLVFNRRTCRTSTIGDPRQNSFLDFAVQLSDRTAEPFSETPSSVSYANVCLRTSTYDPTPGSGHEKKPKSIVSLLASGTYQA